MNPDRPGPSVWALLPFYTLPTSNEWPIKQERLVQTIATLRRYADALVIVDDGAHLDLAVHRLADRVIVLDHNTGKSNAVRKGLAVVLEEADHQDAVLQCDADMDQDPDDALLLLNAAAQRGFERRRPFLLIGDRYPADLTHVPQYRQDLLRFQTALSAGLGLTVRDFVSGFRLYSVEYARRFARLSVSEGYGLEAEQLVLAALCGAFVGAVHLQYSRAREAFTTRSKWLQNVDAMLLHEHALRSSAYSTVCDCLHAIRTPIRHSLDRFVVALDSLGVPGGLVFTRVGDAYTIAYLPSDAPR